MNVMIALGSLGLPVGSQGWYSAVAFAKEHPVRAWTDPLLFYVVIFGLAMILARYRDRQDRLRRLEEPS